jgi:imidazolonepropionase
MRSMIGLPDPNRSRFSRSVTPLMKVAPSILSADFSRLGDEVRAIEEAGADAVDVFCDVGYFDVEQSRRVLLAGREAGLQVRVHADELARSGGSQLAAEVGAASADHLLHVTASDASALGAAGVVATLCPSTALSIGRTPNVEALREAGVTFALGSDHNPGTSGITSMSLVIGLATWVFGLSVEEALRAATVGGAASLRRSDVGVVAEEAGADLVAWDTDHEGAFAWAWGLEPRWVVRAGELVRGDTSPGAGVT